MSVYNPQKPRDYLAIVKAVEQAKECGYSLDIKKFHPVASDAQQRYLHFMISYLAMKLGDTYYTMLREIQKNVCPHVFYTSERDKAGKRKYKPLSALTSADASSVIRNVIDYAAVRDIMIPEPDDKASLAYCERELERSSAGWV